MAREWKPGEVASIEEARGVRRPALVVVGCGHPNHEKAAHFHYSNGRWAQGSGSVLNPRPLAVIDPEDDEQVARLENILEAMGCRIGASVPAALREFADPTPPKPDEPTGLGAVVEDTDGDRYVRHHGDCKPWLPAESFAVSWQDVPAVRVLSEGVQE